MYRVAVLTMSDRAFKGIRPDLSGPLIADILKKKLKNVRIIDYKVIPDEEKIITQNLKRQADRLKVDFIFTTGGTGLAKRDVTPEATQKVIDKELPGIVEATRSFGFKKTAHALLSRAVAGVRKNTVIINLPGSPKAVKDYLELILPALPHAIEIIKGTARE